MRTRPFLQAYWLLFMYIVRRCCEFLFFVLV
ncbi:hypothetical protein EGR_11291 [Echinococcus granulosus]|uniref:Uncharacterized protein n=1 Tax=Echinococcus granulosus TaxID=6210 RepID=W6TYQ7_ECHGR|nr:hypothetical protein EGR_11291 [Echinococcus granulosus]EUB53858.1 hypothetical protein EGR_11291 [Echinococcus granulosus]